MLFFALKIDLGPGCPPSPRNKPCQHGRPPVLQRVPHPSPGSSDNPLPSDHIPSHQAGFPDRFAYGFRQLVSSDLRKYCFSLPTFSPVGTKPLRPRKKALHLSTDAPSRHSFFTAFVCPGSAYAAPFTISPATVFHLHHNPSPGNEPVHVRKFSLPLFFPFRL